MSELENNTPQLYNDVCQIIDGTRSRLASTVNAEVCLLHWHIDKRIKEEGLNNKRAEYGKGWCFAKLQNCLRSAYTFSEDEIMYAVRTQLTNKKILSEKLHRAIAIARENYTGKS